MARTLEWEAITGAWVSRDNTRLAYDATYTDPQRGRNVGRKAVPPHGDRRLVAVGVQLFLRQAVRAPDVAVQRLRAAVLDQLTGPRLVGLREHGLLCRGRVSHQARADRRGIYSSFSSNSSAAEFRQ